MNRAIYGLRDAPQPYAIGLALHTADEGRDCLSLLKIISQHKLEQGRKPRATSRDEPTRAASCTIGGCRVIQI